MKKIKVGRRLKSVALCFVFLLSLLAGGGLKARAATVQRVINTTNLVDFYNELGDGITTAMLTADDLTIVLDLPEGEVQLPDPGLSAPLPTVSGNDLNITFTAKNGPVTLLPHLNTRHFTFGIDTGRLLTLRFADVALDGKGRVAADHQAFVSNGGGIAAFGSAGNLAVENAVIENCVLTNAGDNGGGLRAEGSVTVRDSVFQGNGVEINGTGGGLYAGGNLRIENSRFEKNEARWFYTGGAYAAGTMTVSGSTFRGNFGQTLGGGICAAGSITVENNSLFADNGSCFGGGIYGFGDITVHDSRFEYNRADGGSYNPASGGAIYVSNDSAVVTLQDSSFIKNEATSPSIANGGAVGWPDTFAKNATIAGCSFSGNVADIGYRITASESAVAPYSIWTGNTASTPFSHIANGYDIYYKPSSGAPLYTLIFYQNDGNESTYYANVSLESLSSLLGMFPSDPARTGYQFQSWNTVKDGSGTTVSDTTPISALPSGQNVRLYAQWVKAFTVAFDTGGGSSVASQTIALNGTVTRPADPTRPKYSFTGWFSDAGLSTPYNFSDPVTGDFTLYAGWKASGGTTSSYTVRFNTVGGSQVAAQSVGRNGTLQKPADPTRAGYTFTGWYTEDTCTNLYDFSRRVTGDFTLYVGWRKASKAVEPYIAGYPDGTFRPERAITWAEAAQMLYNLDQNRLITTKADTVHFPDVSADDWYRNAVMYLAEKGIINGYPDGSFGANKAISRTEFTVMIVRYMGLEPAGTPTFRDVPAENWAAGSIAAAESSGLVAGFPDGNFGLDKSMVRCQAVTVLNRMLNRDTKASLFDELSMPFSDVGASHWAYYHIMAAAVQHQADQ